MTYLWGKDMDVPTLIEQCSAAGLTGVELRTTHKHGVEPTLSAAQRAEVKKRFADSPVKLVGIGSDERFDNPDAAVLGKAMAATKDFLVLSKDIGSSGVKVKPDRFHPKVERQKTIEQIGKSLNELGAFAANLGQEVRLEVHGQCAVPTIIKQIMDVADHPAVSVCWNSNAEDLKEKGLEHHFRLLRPRFGATMHVHELEDAKYPYAELFRLVLETKWRGWALLEASSNPKDKKAAMTKQREMFEKLTGMKS